MILSCMLRGESSHDSALVLTYFDFTSAVFSGFVLKILAFVERPFCH